MPIPNLLILFIFNSWHGVSICLGVINHNGAYNMTIANKRIKQWGYSAFARHCRNIGVPFDDCYWMIFGKYPAK